MTNLVWSTIGSGTLPQTRQILPLAQRGSNDTGRAEGVRGGIQVQVANYEDGLAVDAFAASGIVVGTSVVEIISPVRSPLPRCREVIIENIGSQPVYISHLSDFPTLDSFELSNDGTAGASRRVTLPILHNVSVYARTSTGTTTLSLLIT